MSYSANATTATAETPFALDAHESPGTITDRLIVPRSTQKIIPAEFQPTGPAFAAGISPSVLEPLANHGAVDGARAAVGIADYTGNARAVLSKHNFRIAEAVATRPPLAVD